MSEAGTRYSVETGRSGLTYEDFCALPDDGLRYEIVDGMLFAEPAPRRAHQKAVGNLFAILHAWVRAHDLGEVYVAPFDVILDPRTTVAPDLVISVPDRWADRLRAGKCRPHDDPLRSRRARHPARRRREVAPG